MSLRHTLWPVALGAWAALSIGCGDSDSGSDTGTQATDTSSGETTTTTDATSTSEQDTSTTSTDTVAPDSATTETTVTDTGPADVPEETCDGPTTCDDDDPCTEDTVVSGSAVTCDLVCDHRDISDDADDPDDTFADTNCDGIDGDAALLTFVAADGADEDGCGTMDKPCATFERAFAAAALAGADLSLAAGTYDQRLVMRAGISVYGGYDRADGWARAADHAVVIASTAVQDPGSGHAFLEGVYAFGIEAATTLDRVEVRTPDAPTDQGAVSVFGVRLDRSPALVLKNLVVVTGAAAAGAAGADGAGGNAGSPGRSATNRFGAAAGNATTCAAGPAAPGGAKGGDGGYDGVTAAVGTGANSGPQAGGGVPDCGLPGGSAGSNWNNIPISDTAGTAGGPGGNCTLNTARGAGSLASIDLGAAHETSALWLPGFGRAGAVGANGRAGAGGGGGGSGDVDTLSKGGDGGGGGSGTGGGCGGLPGEGGDGGGASIALFARGSIDVTIVASTFTAGSGGAGGAGGAGGDGGLVAEIQGQPAGGAATGSGINGHNGLAGGKGGYGSPGGDGGGGGGGPGGPSFGAVLCGSTLVGDGDGNTFASAETGASGGAGGYPDGVPGAQGPTDDVFDGCELARYGVQIGVVRGDDAVRVTLPGAHVEGATWDQCANGYTLVGKDFQSNGYWLCASDALADGRFVVGNGTAGTFKGWAYQRGNVTDLGNIAKDSCPFGELVGAHGDDADRAWVCAEPKRPHAIAWELEGDAEGWNPKGTTMQIDGDGLTLTVNEGDPWITSPPVAIDASYKKLYVRMQNGTDGAAAELFWMRAGEGASQARARSVAIVSSGAYVEYMIDMTDHAEWSGTIRELRFDYTNASSGTVVIDYIRVGD